MPSVGAFAEGALDEAELLSVLASLRDGDQELTCHPGLAPGSLLEDPTLRHEFQSLHLRANGAARFTVDGKPAPGEWPLVPGRHLIAAMDSRGRRDEVTITVR